MKRLLAITLMVAVSAIPTVADEMQDAMARADALNLFRQINLQPTQARQMVAPLQRIQRIVDTYNGGREANLNRMRPMLEQAQSRLINGDAPTAEMVATLEAYEQQSLREIYRSVDAEMQTIAGALTPVQNQYLDWTAPASIRPEECLEERVRMQQVAMGRIQEAARILDTVKHLHTFNFITGRGPIINDYLALYFGPDAQQFVQEYETSIAYTDQVRMLTEEQWQAEALEIAAAMVEDLGLMPTLEPDRREGTVTWETLFRLMTNRQTLEVARAMAR